jgi:hypothetical protein
VVRRDGIDAVHVSVWEWDGVAATPVERVTLDRAPGDVSAPPAERTEELF